MKGNRKSAGQRFKFSVQLTRGVTATVSVPGQPEPGNLNQKGPGKPGPDASGSAEGELGEDHGTGESERASGSVANGKQPESEGAAVEHGSHDGGSGIQPEGQGPRSNPSRCERASVTQGALVDDDRDAEGGAAQTAV